MPGLLTRKQREQLDEVGSGLTRRERWRIEHRLRRGLIPDEAAHRAYARVVAGIMVANSRRFSPRTLRAIVVLLAITTTLQGVLRLSLQRPVFLAFDLAAASLAWTLVWWAPRSEERSRRNLDHASAALGAEGP